MKIKSTFVFGLTFLFLSCEKQTSKNYTGLKESIDAKDAAIETATFDTITKIQTDQAVSSNQQELNKALANPSIENYYKEVYRQEKLIPADDDLMLSITKKYLQRTPTKTYFSLLSLQNQ